MSKMVFKTTDLKALKPGDFAIFTKTLSDTDAMLFAGISGEMSPLHLNETFAASTEMKTRTVHPMLVASIAGGAVFKLLSPAVQTQSREFKFLRHVFAGDTVTAVAQIRSVDEQAGMVEVEVSCYDQHEQKAMEGLCREKLVYAAEDK